MGYVLLTLRLNTKFLLSNLRREIITAVSRNLNRIIFNSGRKSKPSSRVSIFEFSRNGSSNSQFQSYQRINSILNFPEMEA